MPFGQVNSLRVPRGALRIALVAAMLAALLSALVGGRSQARHPVTGLWLASSSAPFASSSPATTVPSSATTTPATSSASTTVPTARTGEAWSSAWFGWTLALTVLLGVACLEPLVTRRRLMRVRRT